MHAALITAFDSPPGFAEVPDPTAAEGEQVAAVIASAIHPRVRSQADGSHYTSTGVLPIVPGVDGVARTADGALRYFVVEQGAMAERVVLDPRRSVELPADVDPVVMAGVMNPAMSAWIALRRRIELPADARVLVLGATGAAGRMAVQIAKHLGAAQVVAAGRDRTALEATRALGADELVDLGQQPDALERDLAAAGRDADVVLDYLWGAVTPRAMRAIVPARVDDSQPLAWVAIGSMAGTEALIPSAALRATRLAVVGSGQGSVAPREILAELPALAREITSGGYEVAVRGVPLADVAEAWEQAATSRERIVLLP